MAFDLDVHDAPPTTIPLAAGFGDSILTNIYDPKNTLTVDLAQGDLNKIQRFTRNTLFSGDLNMYDIGRLHVCLDGCPTQTLGTLTCSYVVDLYTPQTNEFLIGGGATASAGLSDIHLVGTDWAPNAPSFNSLPVEKYDATYLKVKADYEGIMTAKISGTGLSANFAAAGNLGCIFTNIGQAINGTTSVVANFAVKLVKDALIYFTMTATTVTLADYNWARVSKAKVEL
jgi:hypothetical protein